MLGPYDYSHNGLGKKPRWVVAIQSTAGVEKVMAQLRPYLTNGSPKLEKYEALMAERMEAT